MFVSKIYDISDCWIYNPNTFNLAPNSGLTQINNFQFENDGDWEMSCTFKQPSASCRFALYPSTDTSSFMGIGVNGAGQLADYFGNDTHTYTSFSYNTDYSFKIVKEGTSFKLYSQGNLLTTTSYNPISSASLINIGVRNWGSGTGTIKNVKVKPL